MEVLFWDTYYDIYRIKATINKYTEGTMIQNQNFLANLDV